LEQIRRQTDALLEELQQRSPTAADLARLERLGSEPKQLLQEYTDETAILLERISRAMESNRRSQMTERSGRPPRDQAEIEQLSEEISTKLRLDRVDDAIKELLAFLADADFFAANATTGRKRRLRALQNSLEHALTRA